MEQMSPRTKVEECHHQKTQTQRSNSLDQLQGVIWGDLKTLNTRAEQYAQQLRVLAYLSVGSSNLTKVVLILGLLTCLGGLGLASETNHIYWSHVIDPPMFKLHTWWNPEPPLSSNDTEWTGGTWLPPDGPLEEKHHWLFAPEGTVYVSNHLPACFSVLTNTLCLPIMSKWYAYAMANYTVQQSLPAVNLSLVGAIGFKGERPGNSTKPPNFPLCQIDCGSAKLVTWKLCRDQVPSLISLTPPQ